MTSPRLVISAVVIAAGASVLSGCAAPPDPEPTPSPMFSSEEEAFAAAEEVYRAYWGAHVFVDYSDPTTFEYLLKQLSGDLQATERKSLSRAHAEGYTRHGEPTVVSFTGVKVDADTGTMWAHACIDLRGVAVYDRDGMSLVADDRADTLALEVEFSMINNPLTVKGSNAIEDPLCVVG